MRRGRGCALLLAVTAGAVGAPDALAADNGLVLSPADVPGYRAAGAGAGVARAALGGRVPASLRRAPAKGAAYRAGKRRVSVGAFRLGTASRARRALAGVARGGRRLRVGDGGALRVRSTRRTTDAVAVLRVGSALGAVRVRMPGRAPLARQAAQAYAAALAARLRRVLALTAWQRTLDGIRADGSITPGLALRAFAIAYGPLPGVRNPTGRIGTPESATLAMQLVARVWDRLTPAQRAAVDRALGAPHDASSPRAARAAGDGGVLTPDAGYQAIVDKYANYYRARLPGTAFAINAFKASKEITDKWGVKAYADALPLNAAGEWGTGTPVSCRVRVPPLGQGQSAVFLELVLAHETFHCFQFNLMQDWRQRSAWIIEGMADWAAVTADPVPASVGAGPYKSYLTSPGEALFARSYNASGFWGRAEELGGIGSLWGKIPAILFAPDDATSFALAGGTAQPFVDTWASSVWRFTGAGADWRQLLPFSIPFTQLPLPAAAITGGTAIGSSPYAFTGYSVVRDTSRPLVNVLRLEGGLRAGTSKEDLGLVGNEWFCMGGKCKCPPGRTSSIPEHRNVSAPALSLALTGGPAQAQGRVTFHPVSEFCKKKQPPKPPDGPGESNGDPHMTSLDGLHFDFQAAGEFVLVRSRSGDLEIQARQEPYERSRRVTVNTQLAMRVSGRRVTVSPGTSADDPPVVRIDGALTALPAGTQQPLGAGSVAREAGGEYVDVVWPDGSTVVVRPVGRWGVAARFALAEGRRNAVSGILGDFDGKPGNDLANRRGRRIPYHARASDDWGFLRRFVVAEEFEQRFFDDLYDDVGNAWRIEQRESLFDYGPGQSTRTFTERSIPVRPYDPDDLSRGRRASAARVCRARGVTRPGPLADCIVDMAATGNAAFADDAAAAQEAANVAWTPLRAGAERRDDPTLLEAGDGTLHVALRERTSPSAGRVVDVPIDAAGREGATEVIAPNDGTPSLLAGPDGGVRALVSEIPSGRPSGFYQYARGAGSAWAPLGAVTTYGASYLGRPGGVFLGDGTLISFSPMAGVTRLFRNSGGANPGIEPSAVPAGCYASSPALARDGASGALWLAWVQWDCPQLGVFVQQVDPATGATVGPALQAPGSTWTSSGFQRSVLLGLDERLAFTGRPGQPGLYLAYATDDGARVRLWRVGDRDAVSIPRRRRTQSMRDVEIAAEPGNGRMWIGWTEETRLWLNRTTAGVPEGTPRAVDPPRAAPRPPGSDVGWSIAARGGHVDVLFGVERSGDTPGSLWHGRLGG